MKRRAVFWARLAPVVQSSRRDVGMAEPFLHRGYISSIRKCIGGRSRTRRMHTQPNGLRDKASCLCILHDDVAVDGARIEVPIERAGAVVRNGPEEGRIKTFVAYRPAVFPRFQVLRNQPQY